MTMAALALDAILVRHREMLTAARSTARVSLTVAFSVALLAIGFGLAIGLVTGFSRWTDAIVMRIMDGLISIPPILIAIALMALTKAALRTSSLRSRM